MSLMDVPFIHDLEIDDLITSGRFIDVSDVVWPEGPPVRLLWYTPTFQRWASLSNVAVTKDNLQRVLDSMNRTITETDPETPSIQFNVLASRMDGTPQFARFFAVMAADKHQEAFISLYDYEDAPSRGGLHMPEP